jgi:type I restriction enzyme S subunit
VTAYDWAERLPNDWEARPLRACAQYAVSNVDKVSAKDEIPVRLCNYTDVYNNEFITLSLDFMQSTATEDEIVKFGLLVGDVIITKDSESWDDIGIPALVRETAEDLVCGYHLAILRPRKGVLEGAFLLRCLQAKPIRVQLELAANGVTRFGIPKSEIGGMNVPVPPILRQREIAHYLDAESARLDALIAAKQRMLALMSEKYQVLITRAVTRGLEPYAPFRDSGVSWLGDIPAHWRIVALRFLVNISSGATPDTGNPELWSGDIPWVSPKDMKRNEIGDAEDHVSKLALSMGSLKLIDAGAVLIVVRGMILAHSFPTAVTTQPVTINQDMKALRCLNAIEPYFLRDYFRGTESQIVSLADASAHGTRKLDSEILGRFEICVPPESEQRAITSYIAKETSKLDALYRATERTITLLKERRAALIAAAVTGQIETKERE